MRQRLALAACGLWVSLTLAGGSSPSPTPQFDHSDLDTVLRSVVERELVDYEAIRREHLPALDGYLDRLSSIAVDKLEREEQLALYINLYNAVVLREVAGRFEPDYSVSSNGFRLFDEPLVRLSGRVVSLNDLEHKIIRPGFADPRIHAALVCAARSCPPLLPRAYRGEDIESVLETNMRRFVNDPARNRILTDEKKVVLSRLFDWYAEDFGGKKGRLAYIDRFTETDPRDFSVSFMKYDWTLNVRN